MPHSDHRCTIRYDIPANLDRHTAYTGAAYLRPP